MNKYRQWSYKDEYAQMLIEHMEQGRSFPSFSGVINVPYSTLCRWERNIDSFADAREIGEARALLKMEQLGMAGMIGKIPNFSSKIWALIMKNKFDWTEKMAVTQTSTTESSVKIYLPDNGREGTPNGQEAGTEQGEVQAVQDREPSGKKQNSEVGKVKKTTSQKISKKKIK